MPRRASTSARLSHAHDTHDSSRHLQHTTNKSFPVATGATITKTSHILRRTAKAYVRSATPHTGPYRTARLPVASSVQCVVVCGVWCGAALFALFAFRFSRPRRAMSGAAPRPAPLRAALYPPIPKITLKLHRHGQIDRHTLISYRVLIYIYVS